MQLLIILFPFLELFSLIELGDTIGSVNAILYVIATIFLGITLLKRQGISVLQRAQEMNSGGWISSRWLLDDMAIGFAAMLLIIPGLITDTMALILMIAPLRRILSRKFGDANETGRYSQQTNQGYQASTNRTSRGQTNRKAGSHTESITIIEGEYERKD
jgi:UPF0716 protein FxsA